MSALGNGQQGIINHEAFPGILLMCAAVIALLIDNSPLAWLYDAVLNIPVAVQVSAVKINKPLLLWINDGLMAVFFLLVALEIKQELLEGKLSTWKQSALPLFAALGGMAVPAIIYTALNYNDAEAIRGWAIPAATDIAFALGVLALLGSRVPVALKVFLLAVAIIDDLGAILIIAFFYTENISLMALAVAAVGTALLGVLNQTGVNRLWPYLLVGVVLWVAVLKSGVHATLAGVVVGLLLPIRGKTDADPSLVKNLTHTLHNPVNLVIMPIFAFANAGVNLAGFSLGALLAPLPLGIMLGLFVGKQIGVLGLAWVAVKSGIAKIPDGVDWSHIYGAALLAGIGFTMSLFIGNLAFSDPEQAAGVRIGVLSGSIMSGVAGYMILRYVAQPAPQQPVAAQPADG
jgi:NhaA family Na+:H+ antiporter